MDRGRSQSQRRKLKRVEQVIIIIIRNGKNARLEDENASAALQLSKSTYCREREILHGLWMIVQYTTRGVLESLRDATGLRTMSTI